MYKMKITIFSIFGALYLISNAQACRDPANYTICMGVCKTNLDQCLIHHPNQGECYDYYNTCLRNCWDDHCKETAKKTGKK